MTFKYVNIQYNFIHIVICRKFIISELLIISSLHFITSIMVDLIVYEEQESKYLIVVNVRIIVHRTLYKKGQCIKISNVANNLDNTSFNIKNYITNDILIVNHIELNNDVETSNNIKSIFISNEGYISNKKDIILPIDNDNNNVIVFKLIPKNSFIIRMYNHDWYKIVSQAMIDSVLRQYNYDSIMSNFLFVDSSDDNRINLELSRRNLYNKNIRYNNSRRVSNMNVDEVEAVSNNYSL